MNIGGKGGIPKVTRRGDMGGSKVPQRGDSQGSQKGGEPTLSLERGPRVPRVLLTESCTLNHDIIAEVQWDGPMGDAFRDIILLHWWPEARPEVQTVKHITTL